MIALSRGGLRGAPCAARVVLAMLAGLTAPRTVAYRVEVA